MSGCYSCGASGGNEAKLCSKCNDRKLAQVSALAANISRMGGPGPEEPVYYVGVPAGFWLRFFAFLIDWSLMVLLQALTVATIVIFFASQLMQLGYRLGPQNGSGATPLVALLVPLIGIVALLMAVSSLIGFLYRPVFESSAWRATPGKRVFRIHVETRSARQISMLQAVGRELSRLIAWLPILIVVGTSLVFRQQPTAAGLALIISAILTIIHYPMIFFTSAGTALHDRLTGTRVVLTDNLGTGELMLRIIITLSFASAVSFGAYTLGEQKLNVKSSSTSPVTIKAQPASKSPVS